MSWLPVLVLGIKRVNFSRDYRNRALGNGAISSIEGSSGVAPFSRGSAGGDRGTPTWRALWARVRPPMRPARIRKKEQQTGQQEIDANYSNYQPARTMIDAISPAPRIFQIQLQPEPVNFKTAGSTGKNLNQITNEV
ncbi:MAG: hypothetical protein JSW55_19865 [Chloroflexota bacterium]|nr:MAG: hypothetical protein JSW55_19865 [Chloroflexota bacterium]